MARAAERGLNLGSITARLLMLLDEYGANELDAALVEINGRNAKIGAFKPVADFDWKHPKKIGRALVEELFELDFVTECANVVFFGRQRRRQDMLAQNLAYQAIVRGHAVRFTSASDMLNDLS